MSDDVENEKHRRIRASSIGRMSTDRNGNPSGYEDEGDDDVDDDVEKFRAPVVQMRAKKSRKGMPEAFSNSAGGVGESFKRRSVERHSMIATGDFGARRSPRNAQGRGVGNAGSGRWTDMFTSKRLRKRIQKHFDIAGDDDKYGTVGSTTTLASNSSSECGSRTTPEDEDQIRRQFKDIMHEKNIKDPEVLERMMSTTTTQMMRELIRNSNKTDNAASRKSPEALIGALKQMLRADNVLERKQDMVDVKLQLTCQNLSYTCKFAAGHDHESGRTGFELLCDLYDLLRATRIDSKLEIELIDFLQEVVKCIRSIVNTMSGLGMVLQRSSTACSLLIQTLICLNRRKSPRSAEASPEPLEARLLRADVVKICGLIIMSTLQEDNHAFRSFETTGQQKFFRELTTLAREESKKSTAAVSRFRPFVQCLEFLDVDREDELIYRLLISLNCMITRVADNVPEQAWTEDQMWQMRMRLRSEASRDGWGKYMETLSKRTDKKSVYRVCESYINEQSSDFEHLVAKYENLKAEYDTMDGCFELLTSSASASAVEPILLSIFQLLVLVPEEMAARRAYLKLIECCISEVVLHNAVDPDFETPFVFETPVAEIIEQLQDEETSKKLRQATEAKHAAVAMQFEYWKVLDEFRKESEQLRKHVADPSTPIPAPTKCSLTAPDPSMPAPSTSGLPPITGGPPPPPPPMGLPPITGGPPPPPPMGGIPPVTGGPPPPPPPMGGPGGPPPPPPPPPPPGMLGKGGPPPPPPMGGFGHFVEPPLPEYLSAKKACKVDVPMRKFPWGSNTINPRDIPRESFWVSTNEEKLTSDKLYERLKQRFSSKAPVTALRSEVLNGMTAKKVKVPLVIQDDKVLQRLGILQGSVKMTYVELKNALLEVNEKVLTQEFLGQLRAALPPPEVLKKLAEVDKSQFEEMPEGEQFAASLAAVGGLTLRLDLLEFKMRFEEILNELKPSMSSVMEACEEMRKSTGMRVFLQLALAIGNFMGASTKNHSSVYAFEMRTLTKLVDTKDVENKHTLLHHIIEEMRRADPKIAKFAMKDFHHCVDASRVNADELQRSIAQLKANRNKLENCLKTYKTQSGRDRFEEQMKPFLEKVCKEVATVESMNEKMQRDWTSLTKFYAFNPKKYPMEEFFVDVRTFTEQYTTAWRELESEAEAARVDAKRREKAAQTMKSTRNPLAERQLVSSAAAARPNPRSQAASGRMPTVDSIGVLDELEKATGGEMFLERFLQGARTPRVGIAARTKAGRAALQRQRSRGQETFIGLADYAATPEAATSTATATRTKRTDSETPRHQPGAGGFPRRGAPEAAHGRQSSPLDRVKAVGVSCAVPTGTELRMKVRRKGAPAVPVVATAIEPRTQTSPTHKENREPVLKTSAPTATTTTTTMSTSNPDPDDPHAIPSTDDLLARLSQF